MENRVTVSLNLPANHVKQVMDCLSQTLSFVDFELKVVSDSATIDAPPQTELTERTGKGAVPQSNPEPEAPGFTTQPFVPTLKQLLKESDVRLIEFALANEGRFLNVDLANHLGVEARYTSFPLGHVTKKLQKSGVDVTSAQGDHPWYGNHRMPQGTFLTVRPDILEKFREAMVR